MCTVYRFIATQPHTIFAGYIIIIIIRLFIFFLSSLLSLSLSSLFIRNSRSYQMNQVLDAMFERKVSAGEIVIRQGDDGDNFYVIES